MSHCKDLNTIQLTLNTKNSRKSLFNGVKARIYVWYFEHGTNNLIGHIALYAVKRLPYSSAFVGYAMDEIYVGKGIVTEAVNMVVRFAFEQIGLHRVEAYVSTQNSASMRVLEKAGFQQEGLLRKLLYINGHWVDHYMYARLEDE